VGTEIEGYRSGWFRSVKTVAIIGPNGQLGTDLVKTFNSSGWTVIPLTHDQIQIEEIASVRRALDGQKFEWIINTAAFHKVDECERDPQRAWLINSTGQANVARVVHEIGAKSVFISSDYVFSGTQEVGQSYSEMDPVSPVNAYGHSKAAGEVATLATNPENLVVRISSVFGSAGSSGKGGNFVETIINKAKAGDPLTVVNDIHMSPTYTVDASKKILQALENAMSGILHGSNAGSVTWFGFAKRILELTGLNTSLSESETDWSQPLKRPRNSALTTTNTESEFTGNPQWDLALHRYLVEKGHI
jgi:dTDP-4-dehydrorhamnose reductase